MSGDDPWLAAAGRALGGQARVVARAPLSGGYASAAVERVDLDVGGRPVAVVVKQAPAGEVAAMRARAVVRGIGPPRLLAVAGDRLVTTHHPGVALEPGADVVPDGVWDTLGRVHAHWRGRRPRGVPVVDQAFWRGLCGRTLVAVRGAAARTGDPVFEIAERAVTAWREDPRIARALAVLPRTLAHGDPHRGNVVVGPDGAALIDWGNARVAPAGLDLAVLRAQGASPSPAYECHAGRPSEVERRWGDVHVHVQYLGFACDHLGAPRVAEMVDAASAALDGLGLALR
ncbi:MAG: aminoglycoside phosphotransferase family protein [Pseudonocardia sp.]|nr:aminoglycoside phosphotransferase family protein [Pseudonocardia sp.]